MKPGFSSTPTQPAAMSGSSVYSSSRSDTRSPTTASGRAVACASPGAPGSQPGMGGGGCTWQTAQGALALSAVDDVFADPSDAMNVLAIARVVGDGGTAGATQLYQSRDGGRSFGAPIYTPVPGRTLTGVEIARSDA